VRCRTALFRLVCNLQQQSICDDQGAAWTQELLQTCAENAKGDGCVLMGMQCWIQELLQTCAETVKDFRKATDVC